MNCVPGLQGKPYAALARARFPYTPLTGGVGPLEMEFCGIPGRRLQSDFRETCRPRIRRKVHQYASEWMARSVVEFRVKGRYVRMAVTPEEEKLLRRIFVLEQKLHEKEHPKHSDRCMIELDPDYMGPCTCGATPQKY